MSFIFSTAQSVIGNNSLSLSQFTQIAGAGALLFVSFQSFKQLMIGQKAGPGFFDHHGNYIPQASLFARYK